MSRKKKRAAKPPKIMAEITGAELLARAPRAPALDRPLRCDSGEPEQLIRLPKELGEANPDPLAALREDLDRLVERMQTPAHKAGVDALFAASGKEIAATLAAAHTREGARRQAETKTLKERIAKSSVKSVRAAGRELVDIHAAGQERPNEETRAAKAARAGTAIGDAFSSVAPNRKRARRMHMLFVCSLCRLRSPTAEQVFATQAGWDVMAAGINSGADNPVTPELLEWAEMIFVMEDAHRRKLSTKFSAHLKGKRIVCLNIPDKYDYMDPRLVQQLKAKVPKLVRS